MGPGFAVSEYEFFFQVRRPGAFVHDFERAPTAVDYVESATTLCDVTR